MLRFLKVLKLAFIFQLYSLPGQPHLCANLPSPPKTRMLTSGPAPSSSLAQPLLLLASAHLPADVLKVLKRSKDIDKPNLIITFTPTCTPNLLLPLTFLF